MAVRVRSNEYGKYASPFLIVDRSLEAVQITRFRNGDHRIGRRDHRQLLHDAVRQHPFLLGVAGLGNTPPAVSAAPLEESGSSDQARIVSAVKRVTPSVVALNVTVNGQQFVPTDPFSQFFGGPAQGQLRPYRARASGSGFIYSKDGLIVTNAHVVQFGRGQNIKIEAVFANGDKEPAENLCG